MNSPLQRIQSGAPRSAAIALGFTLLVASGCSQERSKTETIKEETKTKALQIIANECNIIRSFSNKKFDLAFEKSILARGEIMSTNLVQLYHEEVGIESVLLNALDFMRVDADGEPILSEIELRIAKVLELYPTNTLFITQGFICVNPNEELDNLKTSEYLIELVIL